MSQFFEETDPLSKGAPTVAGQDPYKQALGQVREQLSQAFLPEQLSNAGPLVSESCRQLAAQVYDAYNQKAIHELRPPIPFPQAVFLARVQADLLGMGALEPLLADPRIEDIAVNGPQEVLAFGPQGWAPTSIQFESAERLLELLNRGIARSGRVANIVSPVADAILPGRERISVVTHPVSEPWPAAVIRIPHARALQLVDMVRPATEADAALSNPWSGTQPVPEQLMALYGAYPGAVLSPQAAAYLHGAVLSGLNIAVVGPTGVGKTTFLAALGRQIPAGLRVLLIEDTPEIVLHPESSRPLNVIYLRTRPPSLEGTPPITQEDLVKLALRQRPDALTLGEARGAEVFDLLTALNTGHRNGLTSLHAYGEEEIFQRIYLMLSQSERGRHLDAYRAAQLVSSTLHIIVAMELVRDRGRTLRRVRAIAELTGRVREGGALAEPEMQQIFRHTGLLNGRLEGPCVPSAQAAAFQRAGIPEAIYVGAA
ncbi:MAG: CpaF family protein [Anaerolineae bacterium]|nr:CpaF family protein [Anaerolineae bacterium]